MRKSFCSAMTAAAVVPELVFLTGDLGYGALEPLRDALGGRFINAGVAEQNMVSVAAGLARNGLRPWAYSIAPFIYARPFEQIRNDICLHNLPVILVGNGGGYGYGVMGATHHAIEDYGSLLTLQHLQAVIPAFDADVGGAVDYCLRSDGPRYLRLGLGEEPKDYAPQPFGRWRKILEGNAGVILVAGPLAGGLLNAARDLRGEKRPTIWVISVLPLVEAPQELIDDLRRAPTLSVVEEHIEAGGLGQQAALWLVRRGIPLKRFRHYCANGYPSGRYGSQAYHRRLSGLVPADIVRTFAEESPA